MSHSSTTGARMRLSAVLLGWLVAEVILILCGIVIGLAVRDTSIGANLLFFLSGPAGAAQGGYVPDQMGLMVGDVMRIMQSAANALYFLGGPMGAFLGGVVAGELGRGNRGGGVMAGILMALFSTVCALGMGAGADDFLAPQTLLWWPMLLLAAWAGAAIAAHKAGVPGGRVRSRVVQPALTAEAFLLALFVSVFGIQNLVLSVAFDAPLSLLRTLDIVHLAAFAVIALAAIPGARLRRAGCGANRTLRVISGLLVVGGSLVLWIAPITTAAVLAEAVILLGLLLLVLSVNRTGAYVLPKAAGSGFIGLALAVAVSYGLALLVEVNLRLSLLAAAGVALLAYLLLIVVKEEGAGEARPVKPIVHAGTLLVVLIAMRWLPGVIINLFLG